MWNRVATGEEVKVNFGSSWEFTGLGLLSHISHAYYLWNSSCEVELWEICSIKFKILKESTSPFPFFFKKNFFFLFFPSGCTGPQSQHVGSLTFVAVCETLSCDMWDLVPWSGIEPGPPAWGTQSLSYWTTREVPPSSDTASVVLLAATWTPWLEYLVTGRSLPHKPLISDPSISSWRKVFLLQVKIPGGAGFYLKNPPANAQASGVAFLIPGSEGSGGGHGNPTPVFLPGESHG